MDLKDFESLLVKLVDGDLTPFMERAPKQSDFAKVEKKLGCPFHPVHRQILEAYGPMGLQVRDGIYSKRSNSRIVEVEDLEPMLIVPGPDAKLPEPLSILWYAQKLEILKHNGLDHRRIPVLTPRPGTGYFYISDRAGKLERFHDHDGEIEACEQDLIGLFMSEAHAMRSAVTKKLLSRKKRSR